MSAEQTTALIIAVTGLVTALGVLVVQLRVVSKQIDGRLTQLLETTKLAAQKDGELAGRDFVERPTAVVRLVAEQTDSPTGR